MTPYLWDVLIAYGCAVALATGAWFYFGAVAKREAAKKARTKPDDTTRP